MSAQAAALLATGQVESHDIATYLEIRRAGLVAATPAVTGGSVTVDATASIRRRVTAGIIATDDLIPEVESDLLYPGRAHLHVWRGIDFHDDRPGIAVGASTVAPGLELWPLGVFLHTLTTITEDSKGVTMTLGGYDLAKRVSRAAWDAPHVIAAGGSVIAAWSALILDRYPDAVLDVRNVVDGVTAATVFGDRPQADPWEDARTLAALVGAECFTDAEGTFVLQGIPDPLSAPVSAVHVVADPAVPATSRVVSLGRTLDAEKGYSEVVVDANPAGGATPLRGVARDTDPSSATYIDGDYGTVPVFIGGSTATTQGQIDAQAAGSLKVRHAAGDAVSIDLVPIPAHEEGDVIRATGRASKIGGLFVLDAFTCPLGETGAMPASVRRVAA